MRTFEEIWTAMHMIVVPGEYGMEPESFPRDEKAAWIKLGELLDEMLALETNIKSAQSHVFQALRRLDMTMGKIERR